MTVALLRSRRARADRSCATLRCQQVTSPLISATRQHNIGLQTRAARAARPPSRCPCPRRPAGLTTIAAACAATRFMTACAPRAPGLHRPAHARREHVVDAASENQSCQTVPPTRRVDQPSAISCRRSLWAQQWTDGRPASAERTSSNLALPQLRYGSGSRGGCLSGPVGANPRKLAPNLQVKGER